MNPLIAQLTGVLQMTEGAIWQTALVFLRVGAAVALLPGLGEHFLPQRVKLAAVVVLTLIVAPAVSGQTLADLVLERQTERTSLPWVNRRPRKWEVEPLRWLGVHGMYWLYHLADRREARSGTKKTSVLASFANRLTGR